MAQVIKNPRFALALHQGCFPCRNRIFSGTSFEQSRNREEGKVMKPSNQDYGTSNRPARSEGSVKKVVWEGAEVEGVLEAMEERGSPATSNVIYWLLQGCVASKNIALGRRVHDLVLKSGLQSNVFLQGHLIRMYSSCGSLVEANQVFLNVSAPDSFVWTAIVAAHCAHGQAEQAIKLYHSLEGSGRQANGYVFVAVLKACAKAASLTEGKLVHSHVRQAGLECNVHVGNTLVDMYAKCGSLEDARRVFDRLSGRDLVAWTAMIAAYAQHGDGGEALQLFWQMKMDGIRPDKATFVSVLKACSSISALDHGKLIHAYIKRVGLELDVFVGTSLIDMHAKCGNLEDARSVFDRLPVRDQVTWTAIVAGYVQQGDGLEALRLFQQMQQGGMQPDNVTLVSILKACASVAALEQGRLFHANVLGNGFVSDIYVGNTLIDMYAKCGSLKDSHRVFDRLHSKDLVSWNAIIAAYTYWGCSQASLQLFCQMQQAGIQPDKVTLVNLLRACSSMAAMDQGRELHTHIMKHGFESDVQVGSTLIDMYSKCGSLKDALKVFDNLPTKDSVCWSAMIAGYAQHGNGKMALQLFHRMQQMGIRPNSVTFVCLLSACNHSGLLDEAKTLFQHMSQTFAVTPEMEHYVCMVDLLGRSGHLFEAKAFVDSMPLPGNVMIWRSLLGSCRTHVNVEIGRHAYEAILKMNSSQAAPYLLMADIYAAAGRWQDQAEVLQNMRSAGAKKEPGRTWVQYGNEVHTFVVEDKEHPERELIYLQLHKLIDTIKETVGHRQAGVG